MVNSMFLDQKIQNDIKEGTTTAKSKTTGLLLEISSLNCYVNLNKISHYTSSSLVTIFNVTVFIIQAFCVKHVEFCASEVIPSATTTLCGAVGLHWHLTNSVMACGAGRTFVVTGSI